MCIRDRAKPVLVPLSEENGLQYDIEAIRKCVTPHTAGIDVYKRQVQTILQEREEKI